MQPPWESFWCISSTSLSVGFEWGFSRIFQYITEAIVLPLISMDFDLFQGLLLIVVLIVWTGDLLQKMRPIWFHTNWWVKGWVIFWKGYLVMILSYNEVQMHDATLKNDTEILWSIILQMLLSYCHSEHRGLSPTQRQQSYRSDPCCFLLSKWHSFNEVWMKTYLYSRTSWFTLWWKRAVNSLTSPHPLFFLLFSLLIRCIKNLYFRRIFSVVTP